MAQLSRPYQVGLLAVVLLAAAWLLLIQGHNGSPSTAASPSSAPAPASTHAASPPAASATSASTKVYHGSVPGLEGLSKDVAKAKGAVATSKQNARQLQEKSVQASDEATAKAATPAKVTTPPRTAAPAAKAPAAVKAPARATTSAPGGSAQPAAATLSAQPATLSAQRSVEAQLAQGKIVLILFWNPKSADDQAVHKALVQVGHDGRLGIAVHQASAQQVAAFGAITRGVQVYGTPTLLIVDKQGKALTLTGLQDAFSIEQAIQEARQA